MFFVINSVLFNFLMHLNPSSFVSDFIVNFCDNISEGLKTTRMATTVEFRDIISQDQNHEDGYDCGVP